MSGSLRVGLVFGSGWWVVVRAVFVVWVLLHFRFGLRAGLLLCFVCCASFVGVLVGGVVVVGGVWWSSV